MSIEPNRTTLFVNASQTLTAAGPARVRRGAEMSEAGVRVGVGVAVHGERIVAVDGDDVLLSLIHI